MRNRAPKAQRAIDAGVKQATPLKFEHKQTKKLISQAKKYYGLMNSQIAKMNLDEPVFGKTALDEKRIETGDE